MGSIDKIKELRRVILRKFGLRPIDRVFKELKARGHSSFERGLEVFGYTGAYHTMNYTRLVKELHVWEITPECESSLKANLPNATIRIVDSYKAIENTDLKFDLVVIDNHQGCFGENYCEHFEMLPKVFKVLKQEAIVILNVIPDLGELEKAYKGDHKKHRSSRNAWYGQANSEKLTKEFLLEFYNKQCTREGYDTDLSFIIFRNRIVSYLVMGLRKSKV